MEAHFLFVSLLELSLSLSLKLLMLDDVAVLKEQRKGRGQVKSSRGRAFECIHRVKIGLSRQISWRFYQWRSANVAKKKKREPSSPRLLFFMFSVCNHSVDVKTYHSIMPS